MKDRMRIAAVASALALLPCAAPAAAQERDFLFDHPKLTVALRGGWAVPRAGSEIFDFTSDLLTLEREDFAGLAIEGDVAVRVHERLDVVVGAGHSESEIRSEYRDLIGDDDLPIEQTTRFRRTPIEVGLKAYLRDRGRTVSRFAWVPSPWAPYLRAGLGAMVYDFEQFGEFVDYETSDIFDQYWESDGTTFTGHVAGGVDVSLHRHLLLTAEGRYQWADAEMSRDFQDFDPIDLSGFQVTAGFAVRF